MWGSCFFAWIPPLSSVRRRRRATHSLTHSFTHCADSFLAAFGVAGAVHRASWRSCGARGRRWGRGCLVMAGAVHITTQLITTHHNLSHTNSSQLHFSHLTHHSSTAHHNSSQLHFSSQLITAPLLITTYHSPNFITVPLLTPHLSHHNF